MATPAAPSAPAVAPATPAAPSPTPALTPGLKTSEGLLTLIVSLLAAAQANPWVTSIPVAYKLVGSALAVLAVLGYQAQRTSLKKAHLVLHAQLATGVAPSLPQPALVGSAIVKAAAGALVVTLALGFVMPSCGANLAEVKIAAGSAGSAFVACEETNVEATVGIGSGGGSFTFASEILTDLTSGNYLAAIGTAIATYGGVTVACALTAIEDFANSLKTLADSGAVAKTSLSFNGVLADQVLARIAELRAAYGPQLQGAPTAKAKRLKVAK